MGRPICLAAVVLACSLCSTSAAMGRPLHVPPVGTAADLAPQGCVDDNDTGPEACAVSTDALHGAVGVVVSPEGNSLYVISGIVDTDAAIVQFARNTATGALTPLGCIDDTVGPDTCAQSVAGFGRLTDIDVSPDGTSVYVTSESANTVFIFDRDPATGLLTPDGCVNDNNGPSICAQNSPGLGGAKGVAVSSDSLSVFVSSLNDSAVVRFDRDPATGALAPNGCIDDTTGADACALSTPGLAGAFGGSSVALDPRGESLYVASAYDDAVVELTRNRSTKVIGPLG